MREEPLWIDRDELHLLYARQVELFGGSYGVRDENLMESALHRPQMKYNYDPEADLFDSAAAYLTGFTKNHGFVDGNKRIRPGYSPQLPGRKWPANRLPPEELLALVLGVAKSEISERDAAVWLRGHGESRS